MSRSLASTAASSAKCSPAPATYSRRKEQVCRCFSFPLGLVLPLLGQECARACTGHRQNLGRKTTGTTEHTKKKKARVSGTPDKRRVAWLQLARTNPTTTSLRPSTSARIKRQSSVRCEGPRELPKMMDANNSTQMGQRALGSIRLIHSYIKERLEEEKTSLQ